MNLTSEQLPLKCEMCRRDDLDPRNGRIHWAKCDSCAAAGMVPVYRPVACAKCFDAGFKPATAVAQHRHIYHRSGERLTAWVADTQMPGRA